MKFGTAEKRQARKLASYGLTNEIIADVLGTSSATLKRHCQDGLSAGRATAKAELAKTAMQMALSGKSVPMTIFMSKVHLGWTERAEFEVTARGPKEIIFEEMQPAAEDDQ